MHNSTTSGRTESLPDLRKKTQRATGAVAATFWQVRYYEKTVKRIDNHHKFFTEWQSLLAQRADIEKAYAKEVASWGSQVEKVVERSPIYGSMKAAAMGFKNEAFGVERIHRVGERHLNAEFMLGLKTSL